MGASPKWKVKNPEGDYVASFKDIYDAVRFVAQSGDGWSVGYGHGKPNFVQGVDGDALESYDDTVSAIFEKLGW